MRIHHRGINRRQALGAINVLEAPGASIRARLAAAAGFHGNFS